MNTWTQDNLLVVELNMFNPPRLSRSGKTKLVASSGRNTRTKILIEGRPLYVLVNAFIFEPETRDKNGKDKLKKS